MAANYQRQAASLQKLARCKFRKFITYHTLLLRAKVVLLLEVQAVPRAIDLPPSKKKQPATTRQRAMSQVSVRLNAGSSVHPSVRQQPE